MSLIEKYAFRACRAIPTQHFVNVTGPCYSCGKTVSVGVAPADLEKFRAGGFAQDCFQYLGAAEREFLISGICGACWNDMFPPDVDEETTPEE